VPRLVLVSTLPGSVPGPAQRWPAAERFASPAEAITVLAVRRPELSEPSLRREIRYELIHDRHGSWTWRHHPGNLPPARANADGADHPGAADEALWEELGQLGPAATLIRSDWADPLSAPDLARLRQGAPGVQLITIPGGGTDIIATQPAALAAALDQLLTTQPAGTEPQRQR
jgi:pimeloyl-ACP methyl ester carboxylesterase